MTTAWGSPGRKSDCFLRPVRAHTFVNAMKPQKMATCTFGLLTVIVFKLIAKELCYWQSLFVNDKRFFFKTHRHERQYGEDEKAAPEDDVGDENDLQEDEKYNFPLREILFSHLCSSGDPRLTRSTATWRGEYKTPHGGILCLFLSPNDIREPNFYFQTMWSLNEKSFSICMKLTTLVQFHDSFKTFLNVCYICFPASISLHLLFCLTC